MYWDGPYVVVRLPWLQLPEASLLFTRFDPQPKPDPMFQQFSQPLAARFQDAKPILLGVHPGKVVIID